MVMKTSSKNNITTSSDLQDEVKRAVETRLSADTRQQTVTSIPATVHMRPEPITEQHSRQ